MEQLLNIRCLQASSQRWKQVTILHHRRASQIPWQCFLILPLNHICTQTAVQRQACVPINTFFTKSSPLQKTKYFCCCKKFRVKRFLLRYRQWPDSPVADTCPSCRRSSMNHVPRNTTPPVRNSIRQAQRFGLRVCTNTKSIVCLRKTQHNCFSKKIKDTHTPHLKREATCSTKISDAYFKMPGDKNTHTPSLGKGSPDTLHTGWRFTLLCGSSSCQGEFAAPSQHQSCPTHTLSCRVLRAAAWEHSSSCTHKAVSAQKGLLP